MPATFKIKGPFKIPVEKGPNGRWIQVGCPAFWDQPSAGVLARKCGCYVFAMRAGQGIRPIYVGRAQKGFRRECFAMHKIAAHYGPALCQAGKGTPVMFLVVLEQVKGTVNGKAIRSVESFLIQNAVKRNPDLSNVQGKKEEHWKIEGVIRSGKGKSSGAAKKFRASVGI